MSKTVDVLFRAIKDDNTELTAGTINDYFGYMNMLNGEDLQLIYYMYSDLIKRKCVSKDLFENCFFTNRLDELIHKKSKFQPNGYYPEFCAKKIMVGSTYMGDSGVEQMPIIDDDHCPSCEAPGYVTKHQTLTFMAPDCCGCGVYMCKLCVKVQEGDGKCRKCLVK
jgi:hypothetical protein